MAKGLTKQKINKQKAGARRTKKLEKIGALIERKIGEDSIRLRLCCTHQEIFDARKLMNKESTKETLEKSFMDTFAILESRGTINQFHVYAAEEIHEAFHLKTRDVACSIASLEARVDRKGGRPPEMESERQIRLQQQYNRWWINCLHSGVDFNVCMYVILNHTSLADADKHFGKRNGYVKMHLVWGLGRYCDLFRPTARK